MDALSDLLSARAKTFEVAVILLKKFVNTIDPLSAVSLVLLLINPSFSFRSLRTILAF